MADALLVLNAGSSSLKFSVFLDQDLPRRFVGGQIEELNGRPRFHARFVSGAEGNREWPAGQGLGHAGAIAFLLSWCHTGLLRDHRIIAVGHRVVHGGTRLTVPVLVDGGILSELTALIPLAPLHQPHSVAAIRAVTEATPNIPQVACFDTAFHQSQPAVAQVFALPRRFTDEGVRRYGFHGISYEYVASVLARDPSQTSAARTIVAHLGNGASMCAMIGGRSVATTMGFTPLDGLMMGTRCGAIDPGALLYLLDQYRLDVRSLQRLLYEQSGLLGVSEVSSDMRTLLGGSTEHVAEALDLFVYRAGRELGSLAAALGGLDRLVFTGGIGEHAPLIRARICRDASWLGLDLDDDANDRGGPCISQPGSRVAALVVPTNEELMIALHTRQVLRTARQAESRTAPRRRD